MSNFRNFFVEDKEFMVEGVSDKDPYLNGIQGKRRRKDHHPETDARTASKTTGFDPSIRAALREFPAEKSSEDRITHRVAQLVCRHLSARENLRVWQHIYDCPKDSIPQVLELVGLGDTGSKKASKFSLGMKQRLSIAVALLHAPDMLILDEPTNGLDPNGIIEVRELLKRLAVQEGMTILISSHLLAEIEKLVSHVGNIHKGKMLFHGRFEELQQRQQQSSVTLLGVSQPEAAEQLLPPAARVIVLICALARLNGTRTGTHAKSRGGTTSSR